MANDWYVKINKVESGPLSSETLKALALEGKVTRETSIKQGSAGSWVSASELRGLQFRTAANAIPVATPPPARPTESYGSPAIAASQPQLSDRALPPSSPVVDDHIVQASVRKPSSEEYRERQESRSAASRGTESVPQFVSEPTPGPILLVPIMIGVALLAVGLILAFAGYYQMTVAAGGAKLVRAEDITVTNYRANEFGEEKKIYNLGLIADRHDELVLRALESSNSAVQFGAGLFVASIGAAILAFGLMQR